MSRKDTVRHELAAELTAEQEAELAVLAALPEALIDTSEIPPLDDAFWQAAIRNPHYRPVKSQLTVRIDSDVLDWLKASGRGYQTRLNRILREAMIREATAEPGASPRKPR